MVSVDRELLVQKSQEIQGYDEIIAAASGSDAAGKRAIANQIASETQEQYAKQVNSMVAAIEKLAADNPLVLVGIYTTINRELREKFSGQVEEFLTKEKESRDTGAPAVTPEKLEETLVARRAAVDDFKALKAILDMFEIDVSDIPEPKKLTGSRGPRGPRVFTKHQFYIDGEARKESMNNLSSIAATVCQGEGFPEAGWKVKELREYLVSKDVNVEEPPDEFEVTLPNGKVLKAVKQEEEVGSPDEEVEEVEVPEDATV